MKNKHLEHIEDEVLSSGISGVKRTISTLQSLVDMLSGNSRSKVKLTTKWDGAPSIVCGKNPENGKFFVGTKSVFNREPKINYSNEDIDRNHPDSGLNQKLKAALKYLPALGIEGVVQGDMLYTQDDLKTETIDGEKFVTFTPNTITYAIPEDSGLASIIHASKMGIVFHTSYTGTTIAHLTANFKVNISSFKMSRDVWFRDAEYTDVSGQATFTASETAEIQRQLKVLEGYSRKIPAKIITELSVNEELNSVFRIQANKYVRAGKKIANPRKFIGDLTSTVEARYDDAISKLKTPTGKANKNVAKLKAVNNINANIGGLIAIVDFISLATEIKTDIVHKLSALHKTKTFVRTDNGYQVTKPEGFVAVDHDGRAVKLVDRLDFSKNNFNLEKDWTK